MNTRRYAQRSKVAPRPIGIQTSAAGPVFRGMLRDRSDSGAQVQLSGIAAVRHGDAIRLIDTEGEGSRRARVIWLTDLSVGAVHIGVRMGCRWLSNREPARARPRPRRSGNGARPTPRRPRRSTR